MADFSDTTIIIPTLNEAKNIENLIGILEMLYPSVKVIVSDDGSKDGTREIVKRINLKNRNVALLDREKKEIHGLTASVLDAAKIVKTEYLVVMDGDLQHPPEKIKEIVSKLRLNSDIVVGIREKDLTGWGAHRILISKGATALGRARLFLRGKMCSDVMSGFFGVKTGFMQNIIESKQKKFELEGYKVLFDLLKLVPRNTKLQEVPYIFGLRKTGQSKLGKKHTLIYIRALFK